MQSDFDRLLKVCRIRLDKEEKEKMEKELEEIIKYFDVLDSVKIEEVNEQRAKVERLRKDEVKQFDNIEGLLKNTKTYRFYVVGPKV
ncbi:MAG: Asp-tRNA(Asn)/Glu-tRNA(Gln) amidotransferase subunit GatC [Candidatus Micrarchaeota archaeon]